MLVLWPLRLPRLEPLQHLAERLDFHTVTGPVTLSLCLHGVVIPLPRLDNQRLDIRRGSGPIWGGGSPGHSRCGPALSRTAEQLVQPLRVSCTTTPPGVPLRYRLLIDRRVVDRCSTAGATPC